MNLSYFSADLREDWQRMLILAGYVGKVAEDQIGIRTGLCAHLRSLLSGWNAVFSAGAPGLHLGKEKDTESVVSALTLLVVRTSCARWFCAGPSLPLTVVVQCHGLYEETTDFLRRAANLCAHAPSANMRLFGSLPPDIKRLVSAYLYA